MFRRGVNVSSSSVVLYLRTNLSTNPIRWEVIPSNINEPKTIQVTESNLSDVAYPDGKFVEFDDCTKLNNNKDAQNGGCSTGAVDGVAKEKGSKNSVISKEALYYEIAKKTGKSEKEVETIIEGYLLNKEK